MIALGALCALLAVSATIRAFRGDSVVQQRLALLAPSIDTSPSWRTVDDRDLRQAQLFHRRSHLLVSKGIGLVVGATAGALLGAAVGAAVPAAVCSAYAGWIAPSLAVERRGEGPCPAAAGAGGP